MQSIPVARGDRIADNCAPRSHEEMETVKLFAVFWSKHAAANLRDINDYISINNPKNASKVVTDIINLSKSLAVLPLRFEECGELRTKNKIYRKATYASFKIIYKIKAKHVEILAVFHSSQNPKKLSKLRKVN